MPRRRTIKPTGREVIDSFAGKYFFLSNFSRSSIYYLGKSYPTVEHAFQASKTKDPDRRALIASATTPAEAKRLGRRVLLRPDWEEVKVPIMRQLLIEKFSPYHFPRLTEKLLATKPAILIEGNTWGDTFWGRVDGKGLNQLGTLLEDVRAVVAEIPV